MRTKLICAAACILLGAANLAKAEYTMTNNGPAAVTATGANGALGTPAAGVLSPNGTLSTAVDSLGNLNADGTLTDINGVCGSELDILGGDTVPSQLNVSVAWRARNLNEQGQGTGASLPTGIKWLTSDVASVTINSTTLTTLSTPVAYAIQMSFNQSINDALDHSTAGQEFANGSLYLASMSTSGQWENAVSGVAQGSAATQIMQQYPTGLNMSLASFLKTYEISGTTLNDLVGSWGVDTTSMEAWAIVGLPSGAAVNQTTEFAVVPEPSSLALLAAGAIGLAVVALKRRRTCRSIRLAVC